VIGLLAARAWPQTQLVISQRGSWNELSFKAMLRAERLLIGRADQAVSNSHGGADVLAHLGLSADRIVVIPNGIPEERVTVRRGRDDVRRDMGWDRDEVVAWVGRGADAHAAREKDLGTLLAAMDSLRRERPSTRLVMIGPTAEQLAQQGLRLPAWASALGWRDDPADLLNAADALVISSRMEGNSNVAGEALLLGMPVVTTDCGEHCELVAKGSGRVVPVGDAGALASATGDLLSNPPDREAVGAIAMEGLSVEGMASRHLELYDRLLGGSRESG
jgi:glycosyltransferase involved in cell wall biosynthesis